MFPQPILFVIMITTEKVKVRLDPDDITIDQLVYKLKKYDDPGGIIYQLLISKLIEEVVKEVPYHYDITHDYIFLRDVMRSYIPLSLILQLDYILYNKIINDFVEYCRIVHEDKVIRFLCYNSYIRTSVNLKFRQLFRYNHRRETS